MQIDRNELFMLIEKFRNRKGQHDYLSQELADAVIKRFALDQLPSVSRETPATAAEILLAGADAIDQRAEQRDAENGERSMAKAVAAFNALTGHEVSTREGWEFMTILKLARANGGRFHADDYVDGAAYLALAAESVIRGQ